MRQSRKDPFTHGVAFFHPQPNFPLGDRVVDHMQHESEKPVHKVLPSPMLMIQTTFQKRIVRVIC